MLALMMLSFLLLVGLIVRNLVLSNQLSSSAFDYATNQAIVAAEQLEVEFADTMRLTEDLAQELSDGRLDYADIAGRLEQVLTANPDLGGITVAFAEGAFSPEYDLYFVYVASDPAGGFYTEMKESLYDYTAPPSADPAAPQTAWFYNPATSGPTWTEPFLASGAGQVLIEYGVPFSAPGAGTDQLAGVVAVDYSLEGMRKLVAGLDLGLTGFGAVYDDSGAFLSHPVPERIAKGNIFTDESLQDDNFQDAARRALAGETISVRRFVHDEAVWDFFTPLVTTGWALVAQMTEDSFVLGQETLLMNQVAIVLAGGTFLFFLTAVLLHFDRASRDRLWLASITFSVIGVVMILIIIGLARNAPKDLGSGILLTSETALKRYEEGVAQAYVERGLAAPINVPTGVLIQSARFPEPSVVTLNGYVWQRIPKIEGVEITPGISFAQLIDEPAMIEEVYREEREAETLIIWTVTAALRQAFDPEQYPLDLYDINVRFSPLEFANNVVLVPDLQSYNVTAPRSLPGLDDTVRINNWRLIATAFGLDFRQYGTSMGISQRPTVDVPELAYNIRVERRFLGPFIAFFLPALVATIMIFGFLLIDQKPDEPDEIVTALTYTAALFFVVAVLHDALRDNAAAIGLTYLEYFYLLLYVLTLFVALNSFLVVNYPYLPIISVGNNLITKLLFWPVVVSFMLVATLSAFVFTA